MPINAWIAIAMPRGCLATGPLERQTAQAAGLRHLPQRTALERHEELGRNRRCLRDDIGKLHDLVQCDLGTWLD